MSGESIRPDEPPGFITKILVPQQRPDVLSRPRLIDFFNEHLDRKVLLVCAPAGYGKTTLLVDFVHRTELPVCWYSLGPPDADPQVFLEYLVAAVRRRFPSFGERSGRYLRSAGARDLEAAIGLLVTEMHETVEDSFVLVLDDLHTVDNQPSIRKLLDLLIWGLPPGCCCLLASRVIPHIRLSRLVANREMAGLGPSDLRFTAAEIKQLFSHHYKLLLPDARAEELARESEGWIAGIILTSHTLWQGLVKGLIQARRAGGPVFDYLASEVFDDQEPRLQAFLLGTSILQRLSPKRCDALLGRTDSAELLGALDENHLFLSRLEGEGNWYRYHPLFQEFLQARLQRDDPAGCTDLHGRAGELAEAEGDLDAAVDHYLLAETAARAVDLVERVAEATIDAGRVQTLLRWCERLPPDLLAERPRLGIQRARAAFEAGDLALLQTALEAAWTASNRAGDRALVASTLLWRSFPLRSQGRYQEAIADCRAGLAIAEELGDTALVALACKQLGLSLGNAGSVVEAIPVLERALATYATLGDRYNQGAVGHALGLAWKRRGEVRRARAYLDEACEHWRAIGNAGKLAGTLVVLGNLAYELGQTEEALRIQAEAAETALESGYLTMAGYAVWSTGDVQRDRGDFEAAQASYERSLATAERVGDRFLHIGSLDSLGRLHLYAGQTSLAHAAILRARELVRERDSVYERGLCEDAYGVLCLEDGLLDQAVAALEQASEWLAAADAARELARARLHLAQARLLSGSRDPAVELARSALALLPGGASDPMLAIEGPRLAALLRAVEPSGPGWLGEVVRRLGPTSGLAAGKPPVLVRPRAVGLPSIRCYALGRADVEVDGRVLAPGEWATLKTKELWFYLLANGPAPRDRIVDALWPDAEGGGGHSAFYTTVHRLRRALFPDCVERRRGDLWGVPRGAIVWTDDRDFEQLATSLRRPAGAEPTRDLTAVAAEAIELYRGPYLAELDAEWCDRRRRQLENLYLRLLLMLIEQARAESQPARAIGYAELYLQTDPDNEAVHEALMRCHVVLGNRPAALRHYQQYVEQLRAELEADPPPRLRLLSEQLARER